MTPNKALLGRGAGPTAREIRRAGYPQTGRDDPATADLVDDVDRVVSRYVPATPRNIQPSARRRVCPPERGPQKGERPALELVVGPSSLKDAVDVDLEGLPRFVRQRYRPLLTHRGHRSPGGPPLAAPRPPRPIRSRRAALEAHSARRSPHPGPDPRPRRARRQRRRRSARLRDGRTAAISTTLLDRDRDHGRGLPRRRGRARLVPLPLPPAPGTAFDETGPQIHGNTRLELIWTADPAPDPRRDHGRHDRQAARASRRAGGQATTRSSCRSRRTSSTGSTTTRTASSRSTAWVAGRPPRPARGHHRRRRPQLVGPGPDGKRDAIPGRTNTARLHRPPRRPSGPVRRVLRRAARRHAHAGRGRAAGRVSRRGSPISAPARRQRGRPTSGREIVGGRVRDSATASRARATSARGSPATPSSPTRRPRRSSSPTGRTRENPDTCPRSREGLARAPDARRSRLPRGAPDSQAACAARRMRWR